MGVTDVIRVLALSGRFRNSPNASHTLRLSHTTLHTSNGLMRYEPQLAGRLPRQASTHCSSRPNCARPVRHVMSRSLQADCHGKCPPFPALASARYEPQLAGRLPRQVHATRPAPALRAAPYSCHKHVLYIPLVSPPDRHITCPRLPVLAAPRRRPLAARQHRILAAHPSLFLSPGGTS